MTITANHAQLPLDWNTAGCPLPAPRTATAASTPELADYDRILVNSSAGKDSQASLHVVAMAARAAGVSDRIVVVHADLGDAEWDGVPQLAAEHAATTGCASSW